MRLLAIFLLLTNLLFGQQSYEHQSIDRFLEEISKSSVNPNIQLTDIELQSAHTSKKSGIQHAYLIQKANDIPIIGTESSIHLTKDGNLLQLNNRFIENVVSVKSHSPALSAKQALQTVSNQLNYNQVSQFKQVGIQTTNNQYVFSNPLVSNSDIPVELVYFRDEFHQIYLAWNLSIEEVGGMNWWSIIMNATNGAILAKNNWMQHCNFGSCDHSDHSPSKNNQPEDWFPKQHQQKNTGTTASYQVFELPLHNPADGSRSLVSFQSNSASPFGWHDTSSVSLYTITKGNNAHAYEDDGSTWGYSPDGGASLNFDFPLDLTQSPTQYLDAGITNLFYTTNVIHDILYANGFDEAAGNCQLRNYTGQGDDEDHVRVVAQFGNLCNASFAAPPDGASPIMHNWICSGRDGAHSNVVIAHEYAHGLSHRLTGGATNSNCLHNDEQMGEGWSDYLGVLLTMKASDVGADPRPIASWFLNKPNGIRAYPYSTDMTINPITYDRIRTMSIPYGTGLNWCTMLWEMTWGLIDQHGFDADMYNGTGGNNIALELVIEGMKLQPCLPGFVDGRDAILAADLAMYGGANQCIIWEAFAKRGLGECADQGLSSDKTDGIEGFRVPASCGGTVCDVTAGGNTEYNATWSAVQNVQFLHSVSSPNATWTASTDAPWIILNTPTGIGSGHVSFDLIANTSLVHRTGFIKVSCDSLCFVTFKVTQGVQPCNPNYSALPYYVNFETGVLDQYWCILSSEPEGNIQITSQHSPLDTNHLTLDAGGSNTKNLNVASMGVKLLGQSGVTLSFEWKEFNNENNAEDGIYFSDDGGSTFIKVFSLVNGTSTYQTENLNVSQIANNNGLSHTNTFVIRFQQAGTKAIPNDGFAFDNILVKSNYCPPGIPCNDNDICTINDTYNPFCNCTGVLIDADGDGVCDFYDVCPGGDDNEDLDGDGTPDFCDSNTTCTSCNFLINTFPHIENFEALTKICQYYGDDFNWYTTQGGTSTNGTGPDAAYEGYKYFFIEADYNLNETGIFQSGCYDLTNLTGAEMDFWYHMRGSQMGSLSLEVSIDTGRTWIPTATFTGNLGNSWYYQLVDLAPYLGHVFTYRFIGKVGNGNKSDMALDLITIRNLSCTPGTTCDDLDPCTINDNYDSSCNCKGIFQDMDNDGVCDLNDVCPGYDDNIDFDGDGIPDDCDNSTGCNNCSTVISTYPHSEDFEPALNEICQFTGDDFDWDIRYGSTPTAITGPTAAFQGQYYFYTESSYPNAPNKLAAFQSGCYDIPVSGDYQLEFWYHMYGSSIGTLDLDITIDTGRTWINYLTVSGNQGNQWNRHSVDLASFSGERISYRFGARTGGVTSDFALDSITINLIPTCAGNSCNDGDPCTINDVYDNICNCAGTFQDTDYDTVCDANDTCPGHDDNIDLDGDGIPDGCDQEISCEDCSTLITTYPHSEDFESGLKEICQFTGDDFDWITNSGPTNTSNTGPVSAYQGVNYFYVESSSPNAPDKTAAFQSGCYSIPSSGNYILDFWYHMYGATMGEINLDITIDTGRTWINLWTKSGDQANQWNYQSIDLSSYSGERLSYRFVATTSYGITSDFALDNITIDLGSNCVIGSSCNDGDQCTINDVLDVSCNCIGMFQDTDNDNVCDADDLCPGFDDNIDVDGNGIPDDCDQAIGCNDCSMVITTYPHIEDFESAQSDICQYTGDDIDWIIHTGATPSTTTGPLAAFQGLNYFYTESSAPNNPYKVAIFQGGCYDIPASGTCQMDFWYHMYGLTMGTINLEITIDTGRTWITHWTESGNQGTNWHYQMVDLSPYVGKRLSYRFIAATGPGASSDFALDSITIDFVPTCVTGNSCNDGDACTINDVFDASCNCAGTFQDTDMDSVCDANDSCPGFDDNIDADADGVPDDCDTCPGFDDTLDGDGDGVADGCDNCPGFDDNVDGDGDGIADGCDLCPGFDDTIDSDSDGVADGCDSCPGFDDNIDADADGVPDDCDTCPGFDDTIDGDGDGIADGCDVCPGFDDTIDSDSDGVADGCDSCPGFDDNIDVDGDGVADGCDLAIGCHDCDLVIISYPHTEDFEMAITEICQYSGDDFNWNIQSGPTPTNNTGPTTAFQGQNYYYTESNAPNVPTKIATFQGGCYDIPATGNYQLDFWYHMYGFAMGTLELDITIDTGRTWINLWTASGDHGDNWLYNMIDLSPYAGERLSYRFTGTTSNGATSDFALDSITIDLTPLCIVGNSCNDGDPCTINDIFDTSCNCIGNFQDTDMDNVCDANDLCPGFNDNIDIDGDGIPDDCDLAIGCNDCSNVIIAYPHTEDFESGQNDLCQYTGEGFDWEIQSGPTPSINTGPTGAYQGVNYFFTESSGVNNPNKVATFQGSCYDIPLSGSYQLDFWYHMYGLKMGSMDLEITIDTGRTWINLWTQSGDQGDVWLYQMVDLSAYSGERLSYRFKATTGNGSTSDFAVDSITIDLTPICVAGTPCNDIDSCTINDILDADCNCIGTFQDTDLDSVCDAEDICPGHDDTIDDDGDGVPNGCDSVMTSNIELNQGLEFSVYPNPFSDVLSIEISSQNTRAVLGRIELVDMMGRVIFKQEREWSTELTTQVSINYLADGVYYVKYWDDKHEMVKKVVKVR